MNTRFLLLPLFALAAVMAACDREEPAIVAPPDTTVPVKMNEVYSRGDATSPDWIEIYNPNSKPIDISGYRIYDSGGQGGTKPKMQIPAGTTLPAMGFFVLTVDTQEEAGFGISSGGETVWFENAAGALIDSVAIPALGVDTSYARVPDGAANWTKLTLPSRGTTNVTGGGALPVVVNESYSRGVATDPDWIEIYNPNDAPVTIAGYKIYDTGGNSGTKPKMEFPAGAVVPGKGHYVIVVDVSDEFGFGLSSGGDEVWLENAAGTVIDNVAIPAMETTQSYGRFPDGSATMKLLNTITRGSANIE
jgi:hypothetical protein